MCMLCTWCAEPTQLISNTHHAPTPSTDYLQASPKARERGVQGKCGPKPPQPTPLTADYRYQAAQRPGAHNDRTIGPEACRGMRAAPIVARVATAPPTLQTVGMVVVSGGQARGGGNGKRGGGRLVGG